MKPRAVWASLTSEPYRILLALGTFQLIAALLVWNTGLIGQLVGVQSGMVTRLPPGGVHGLLMLYMVFPFFIFGFLMTTYPRWLDAPTVPRSRYLPTALLLGAGSLIVYAGMYASAAITVAGVLVVVCGHLLAMWTLWATQRHGRIQGRFYERYLHLALLLGAAGMLLAVVALHGRTQFWPLARMLGLWGFLVPVLVTMSHRMLPFLTSCVVGTDPVNQPRGGPHAMLILIAAHGLLELGGQQRWLWIIDLPLALIAAHHLRCWAFARCMHARLLAMFHIAFAWFVVAMLFYALDSLQLFVGMPDRLMRAPLHALGIGFALGMTLAMVTRIAQVHAGLAPVATAPVWFAFWAVNCAAVLRMAAEPIPLTILIPLSGVLLLLATLVWATHILPLLLKRPRVDVA